MTDDAGTAGSNPVVAEGVVALARRQRETLRELCRRRPTACLLVALACLVLSVLCLLQAVTQFDLGAALLWVTAGGALGATGLLIANETIAAWMAAGRTALWASAGIVLIVGGTTITWLGLAGGRGPAAAAGLVAVMVGLLPVNNLPGGTGTSWPLAWVVLGAASMAIGPVLLGQGGDRRRLAGVALWLAGLAVFKLGVLPLVDRPWLGALGRVGPAARAWIVTVTGLGCAGIGFVLFRAGAGDERPTLLGVGLLLVLAGLSAAGLAGVRAIDNGIVGSTALILGALATTGGVIEVFGVIGDWALLISVVCGVLATFGAWFVFRGEGLVFLVLIGFVLVWALDDRNDAEPTPVVDGAGTILALGDSFMSGEGARNFLPNTHTKAPEGNTCRRASTAHAALVAQDLGLNLRNLACSGARAGHIAEAGQKAEEDPEFRSTVPGTLPQLDNLTDADIASLEVVLVSIGGNDTGFSTIITACLLPSNCADQQPVWLAKAESIEAELVSVYGAIRDKVGTDVPIVVVPYPTFIDTTDCDLAVSSAELAFVAEFLPTLNNTILRAAQTAGVHVADLTGAFEGSRLCDDVPGANFIRLAPPDGPISARLNPAFWIDGSMHPREEGHRLIGNVTRGIVEALLNDAAQVPGTVDLTDVPSARLPGEAPALVEAADRLLTDKRWVSDQLYDTARRIILPIALLLAGGMLLALGLRAVGFPPAVFLSPREASAAGRRDN